ncbi:MAG: DEAD/DEAH box helicase [Actinomycetota bacterium]
MADRTGGTKSPPRARTSSTPALRAFEQSHGFPFDDFQRRACDALADGASVLVAAPTGAGKTVVGEFAAWLALKGGGKAFYTTPIKALSNQKYGDFVGLHGASNVGLLTGDNSLNGEAPVVVMTTEVLRNMIYEDSPTLDGLRYVVLDEVHYLQDPYRGAVWEEILIHLPVDVQTVSLSATVSNAEEFGEWLQTLRGRVEVIIEEQRPVELRHWYFAGDELLPMFVHKPDGEPLPNPRGRDFDRRRRGRSSDSYRPRRGGRRPRGSGHRIPLRTEVVDRLGAEQMLPAIYFVFSRRGCDEAVRQCIRDNVRLTTDEQRTRIREYADSRVTELSPEDLDVLGYAEWVEGLARGVAAHHAGLIPPFKETVEDLFVRNLVKVVFATETLALGINMPARTVVIENLTKFTGEKHELMTPGEYTQFAGRAGRRGIDELGHSVVLLQRFTPFDTISRLASARTYPLQSSFQPSYNMAVNLVRNYDLEEAEHLMNSSFAQFQTDRDVVRLEQSKERLEAYLASYRERMRCERGDFEEYRELRDRLDRKEGSTARRSGRTRQERVLEAIGALRAGDVFDVAGGKRRGRYAVLEISRRKSERQPRVLALSEERSMVRFSPSDFRDPPTPIAHLRLPPQFEVRDQRARRRLAHKLAEVTPERPERTAAEDREEREELKSLRQAVESHRCHSCPEVGRHLHFAERAGRLQREVRGLDRRIGRRTGTLARRFERVLEILELLGYVKEWSLTDKGETLTRVYNEADLLVVEALEQGLLDPLTPAELAAVLSTLVYETRGPEAPTGHMPTRAAADVYSPLLRVFRKIHQQEEERGLELTREPDPGFAEKAYWWADGSPLDEVLDEDDAPGDFVRSTKQLVDLLRQVDEIAPTAELQEKVKATIASLHRSVVSYSTVEL